LTDYRSCGLPADAALPFALIEEAVAVTGCREQRRRLLPAAGVVVFVLGCCLFAGEGYGEVARKLAGWLSPLAGPGGWRVPGTAALARARRRAGPAPLRVLFSRLAGPLAMADMPGVFAFGRLLAALDGTVLQVPHTPANIAAFGPPPVRHGSGGYPQVRLVTLAACGTRGLIDAMFRGRCAARSSEQDLARTIAARGRLGRGMLVLADRNFCGYPVAACLTATGADVLLRAKSSQRFPVLDVLPDGSYLSVLPDPAAVRAWSHRNGERRRRGSLLPPDSRSRLPGITIRVIEAAITITPAGGTPRSEQYRLITTMLDPAQAPALQVATCYAQRWEIETSYRELKVFTRTPGQVLRSCDPAGAAQEIWALLCACQLICAARTAAAATTSGLDPDRISATVTLRAVRRALTTTPAAPAAITTEALAQLLPLRRHRSYPRAMNTSTAKRRAARTGLTGSITYTITVTTPASPDQPGP
jgi:Insertion element 4 transposase N-terminal/Transposase DDE domain